MEQEININGQASFHKEIPVHEQEIVHESFFKKWGSLFVLGLGLAIIIIDTTLLNVSLGTIIREFNTDIQSIQWVITAYSLTLAALTITGGRIGDLFGRKKMFMVGAVIFAVGSFIASISQNIPTMLIGESIVEGIGAALMMPATASLLVANFKGRDRAVAFGVWGGIAGAASAIGPILGGYLTNNFSWRWGFRINIVIAIILVLGSLLLVKESHDTKEKPTLDIMGVILSAIGLLGVVFGIIESSEYGWWFAKKDIVLGSNSIDLFGLSFVPFIIITGFFFLGLFLEWEKRVEAQGKTPLVSLKLFFNRAFTAGSTTTAIVSLSMVGLIFALPVFLQSVLRLDAFNTGVAMLPLSLTMLVVAPLSAVIGHKIGAKTLIMIGSFLTVVAMFVLRQSISVDATTLSLVPGLMLFGMGMGMVMAQVSNLTLSAVPVYQAGEASGVNNTLRQVGSTLGSAVIGAVLLSTLSASLVSGINKSTLIPQGYKSQISQAISNQTSNVEFGGGAQVGKALPPVVVHEIESISKQASVDAARTSMLYAAFFGFIGFLATLTLPGLKVSSKNSAPVGH